MYLDRRKHVFFTTLRHFDRLFIEPEEQNTICKYASRLFYVQQYEPTC